MRIQPILLTLSTLLLGLLAPVTADEARIDSILKTAHASAGITPAALVDERIFLRRATLDLVGRVPTMDEIESFHKAYEHASGRELARIQCIDELLNSDEFNEYWSQLWTSILVGRNTRENTDRESLRGWLETAFRENKPFDQVAFDLISAQGVTSLDGPVNFLVGNREDPVTSVSRVFLGVQLDCARCHDHPYDHWTEEDYTLMRRFFDAADFREVSGGIRLGDEGRNKSNEKTLPQFLTGARPRTAAWRREMALMTVRSKPFARAIGNRVWQLLFGRGIVDPVDGLSQHDRPSVPELHQALADQLLGQQFDLRQLIRTICLSDAYRRQPVIRQAATSASRDAPGLEPTTLFAARQIRPLLPEQLIRSYNSVMDREQPSPEEWNERSVEFLGRSSAATGSSDPLGATRTSQGLLTELAVDVLHPIGGLDSIFLSTLSRLPSDWERELLRETPRRDLLYSLLHCNEFIFCQ